MSNAKQAILEKVNYVCYSVQKRKQGMWGGVYELDYGKEGAIDGEPEKPSIVFAKLGLTLSWELSVLTN